MNSAMLLPFIQCFDDPVAVVSKENAALLWGSLLFTTRVWLPGQASGCPPLQQALLEHPSVRELMHRLQQGHKITEQPLIIPFSMPSWSGELHVAPLCWEDGLELVVVFRGQGVLNALAMENRRSQALSELSSSPILTQGNYKEACKLITKIAADTLGTARASIWSLEGEELINVVVYDRELNEYTVYSPFSIHKYPKYV